MAQDTMVQGNVLERAVDRGGRSKLRSVVLGRTGGPWPEEIGERASRSMSTTIGPKVRDVM